jgi:hypothetical protein
VARPYSRVEHLVRSLWLGRFAWTNRVAMYSAYFDESGTPDDGPYMVVAGCIADVDQWVHFEREWVTALTPFGTNVFHTADFDQRNPPFDKLTNREADELFARLTGIICRRINRTFSHAIPLAQYDAINSEYLLAECYGFPYPATARICISHVVAWAQQYHVPKEELLYFFEDGAKHKGQLEWIAERDGLSIPVFRKKAEVVALQAADVAAWLGNLCLTSRSVPRRYGNALDRISGVSDWGVSKSYADGDFLPTLLKIPRRDENYRYKCTIVKKYGHRRALVHYWPKTKAIEPKLDRKTLVLPERSALTPEEVDKAIAEYKAKKRGDVP